MHCVNRIKFCGCTDNHFYISPSLRVMSVTMSTITCYNYILIF